MAALIRRPSLDSSLLCQAFDFGFGMLELDDEAAIGGSLDGLAGIFFPAPLPAWLAFAFEAGFAACAGPRARSLESDAGCTGGSMSKWA